MSRILLSGLLATLFVTVATAEDRPIAATAKEISPLKAGDTLPDVSVKDATDATVKLSSLHADGPVVIVFFRGSWCPFCTKHFQELIKAYPEITKHGAKLVAISPDSVENTQTNSKKLKVPFQVLSDSNVEAAKAFGLAFKVDDATITKYKGFGIDLTKASGNNHHALPVPAVYIVDQAGTVQFAHSDADYTKRLDVKTILSELKKLK